MYERLVDVVAAAIVWDKVSEVLTDLAVAGLPGIDPDSLGIAEFRAHESLVHAILDYADAYRGFEQIGDELARIERGDER